MISGFHKLSTKQKRELIASLKLINTEDVELLKSLDLRDKDFQERLEAFSENVIGNFNLPYSVVPNVVINNKTYLVPFVTEESSVVAAAASSAKFWADKGGFLCKIEGTEKIGTVYFTWEGKEDDLLEAWGEIEERCLQSVEHLSKGMKRRGGGVLGMSVNQLDGIPGEYKLKVRFATQDAMGANYINSCLERMGKVLVEYLNNSFTGSNPADVTMAILSNNTPNCLVSCKVSCDVHALDDVIVGMKGHQFAAKFKRAADIAWFDEDRAVTHNKGIMNGIAAATVATANDFRAVEAGAHASAFKDGQYRALSSVRIKNDTFTFSLQVPLAVGTVGGLTKLHPLAALSFKILGEPNAEELMKIIAVAGLASNFAAIKSLVSDGIQKGHMKMHLSNLLLNLNANPKEELAVRKHFEKRDISSSAIKKFIDDIRSK